MFRRALICMAMLSLRAAAEESWGPGDSDIVLSEIHFHPPDEEGSREFIELHNAGVLWVNVGGWSFSSGIEFTIPDGTVIEPGGFLVVARSAAAMRPVSKSPVVGDFKGNLSNTGELIELKSRTGRAVAWVRYDDGGGGSLWPQKPDGHGPSLELIDPDGDWHRPWCWGASRVPGGTPGAVNSRSASLSRPDLPNLRINEARLEGSEPFVEIFNEDQVARKLDGLRLTGDLAGEGGADVSGTVQKRRFQLVDGEAVKKLLPVKHGILFLVDAASRDIVDSILVRKSVPPAGSFGRYPDGGGDVHTYSKSTPNAANLAPAPSSLVINEILYNGRSGTKDEEFVEIFNRGKSAVPLKGWKLERAVTFRFPDDAVIEPGAYAVVAGDPAKLRGKLGPAEAKLVFGPFEGKLSHSGATVALADDHGDIADRVPYHDRAPWPKGADGSGASIELISPDLDNSQAPAWTLGGPGGTPGKKNLRAQKSVPPSITGVHHEPVVPTPEDTVVIHAHVVDTGGLSDVSVVYRDLSGASNAVKKAMSDRGDGDDGAPKDGHYAVRLPKLRAGALVAFSIHAKDTSGKTVRFPSSGGDLFFQVEPRSKGSTGPGTPVYRILMPRDAWDRFARASPMQDTLFPCTFTVSFEGRGVNEGAARAFYGAAIRYRGNNSRNPRDGRYSYRVALAAGDTLEGRDRLILNAFASLKQKVGGDVMHLAGLPVPDATVIRLKTPGFDDPRYVDVEVVNNEFLDRRFSSSGGEIYRGQRGRRFGADLSYHGPDQEPYRTAYVKENKKGSTDLTALLKFLENLNTKDDAKYPQKIEEVLDPVEWAAYFAVNHVLGNDENGLPKGVADDFFLAQRPTDKKFILVPWDEDSVCERSPTEPLFTFGVPAVRRFLQHPRFAPLYHRAAREVIDGPLSRASLKRRLSRLAPLFPAEGIAEIEDYCERRGAFLRERYVSWPEAVVASEGSAPSTSGCGTKIFLGEGVEAGVTIAGLVDPAVAFKVRAGGDAAVYDAVSGRWSAVQPTSSLARGSNLFWVELLGGRGEVAAAHAIVLDRGRAPRLAPQSIEGNVEWKASDGPYLLQGDVVIASGSSLRVAAGADIVCAGSSSLAARGVLVVEGTAAAPVTFRPGDEGRSWRGVKLHGGGGGGEKLRHSLAHARFEGGRGQAVAANTANAPFAGEGAFLEVVGSSALLDHCVFRGIAGIAVGAQNGAIELRGTRIADGRSGIVAREGSVRISGCEIQRLSGTGARFLNVEKEALVGDGTAFREVQGAALVFQGAAGSLDSVLVQGCGTGIAVQGGSRVKAARLTVVSNAVGLAIGGAARAPSPRSRGPAPAAGSAAAEVSQSVLGPNVEPISVAPGSKLSVTRSVVPPGAGDLKGEGIIAGFARFLAPSRGDFRLAPGSPGKGAGPGGADYGAAPPSS